MLKKLQNVTYLYLFSGYDNVSDQPELSPDSSPWEK